MRWLNGNRKRLMLVGFVAAIALIGGSAKADFTFSEPVNLGPEINSPKDDFGPEISADGLVLYMATDRPGGKGDTDVWISTRPTKDDEWGSPVHLEGPLNTSYAIWEVGLTADGLQLYFSDGPFSAFMPGGHGNGDTWVATRSSTSESFGPPVNMPAIINSDHAAWADISPDGLELYITSHRTGSIGACDIWMAKRASEDSPWGSPVNLGSDVNSGPPDQTPDICYDGLTLFWAKGEGPDGMDLWMARREDRSQPFGAAVALPDGVNTTVGEFGPCLSPDGTVLYFSSNRPGGLGGFDLWQVAITPIVDFNGDGIVDAADMCIMVDYWGTDEPLCDIGPMPWGDGIVDVQDLIVLSEHLFEEVNDPTLIAHWALDETEGMFAADSVGDNDAFVVSGSAWQPGSGQVDGALQLNGVDGCAIAGAVLNPADGPFSIFAWVNGGAPGQVIVSQQATADWLATDAEGNLITELICTGRSAGPLYCETVITDGQWHRIGLVWDGSHRTLCVDGVTVAEDAQPGLEGSQMGLYIGTGKAMEPGTYFSGLIDEIRIYNRVVHP
ncbi:LamG-like jellyroll fold domain-containing protein [Planctomycetota bacterium]